MRIKNFILIIGFICIDADFVFADAFPKFPVTMGGGPVISLELLGSYEINFNSNAGILIWGGFASVFSPLAFEINAGPEIALEFRQYFSEKENKKWTFSIYSGLAHNYIGEDYTAFTPGVKITRKKTINHILQLEPYISLSYPFYFDGTLPLLPDITFGYRIVLEKRMKR